MANIELLETVLAYIEKLEESDLGDKEKDSAPEIWEQDVWIIQDDCQTYPLRVHTVYPLRVCAALAACEATS